MSRMRSTSSPFGQQMPPGMLILRYSANGRPSTMTKLSPALPHGLEVLRGNARRVARMLDQLAEHLARHVDAGIERVAGALLHAGAPPSSTDTLRIAERRCPRRGPRGDAVPVVAQHQPHRPVRHQGGKAQLEAAVGQRHGEEQVAHPVLAVLAHVEERDLAAVREPGLQRRRIDRHRSCFSCGHCAAVIVRSPVGSSVASIGPMRPLARVGCSPRALLAQAPMG